MRKAILCLLLAVLAVICLFLPAYSQATTMAASTTTYRGDINEDGKVNIFDLLELLKTLANPSGKTERTLQIADVDASGGVNIFDLLGLLKVLSGSQQPGVIYWGPVITGHSGEGASPGDTLVVYTENVEAGISTAQVRALVEGAVTPVISFSPDSTRVLIPASFSGGNLALVFGPDTTNSYYVRFLLKVIGKVESIAGVNLTELTVVSIQAEDKVSGDGSFDARLSDSTEATFVVATNASGAPVLLSFMTNVPGTGLAGVKGKEGFTRLAASGDLSLGVQSTALSLVMLNPSVFGTSAQERKTFAERAMQHSRFQELVNQISTILASGVNTNYLVDDSHPEIFQLANEIAVAVYDGMEQQGLLHLAAMPSRPDPGIQVGSGGQVGFSNPYYIYYGTSLFDYGSATPKTTFIQNPRPRKWGFVPYVGDYGLTSEAVLSGDSLTAVIKKGFDFSDPNWYNWNYPQGRGTLYNSGKILLDLVDLVIKLPGIEEKLGLIVECIQDGFDVEDIRHGFETRNGAEVLRGFLELCKSKSDVIIYKLFWQSAGTDKMRNCVNLVHSVAGNVIKVLTVVEKVPFYVDLFAAPGSVTKDFVINNNQIVVILPTYTVSGRVLSGSSGLSGVSVRITGTGKDTTVTTGSDGRYSLIGLVNGTYTVTPTKSGYSLSSIQVTINGANVTVADIYATLLAPEISISPTAIDFGTIYTNSSGTGTFTISNTGNAALTVSSISSSNSTLFSVNQASASIASGKGQTVTVTFTPQAEQSYTGTITVKSNDSDEGTLIVSVSGTGKIYVIPTYSVQGSVKVSGSGLSGVSVLITGTGVSNTSTTGTSGAYSFSGLDNGTYTVTPSKSGYTFTPASQTATVNNANATVGDFTASAVVNNPTLAAYELSPATVTVAPGGSFTARYRIYNPNTSSIQVRLDLRYRTSEGVYNEFEPYDTTLTIQPDTAWYERPCRVPAGLADGALEVAWYLLKGTDNSQITSTSYISGKVTIQNGGGTTPGDTTVIQGITFVSIPGGTFQMGQDGVATPVHQVTVSAFQMSAKEITNSQYAAYLNAALAAGEITATTSSVTGAKGDYSGQMYIELSGSYNSNNRCWTSYNGTSFSVAAGKENWPVVYVTWYGSKAFAVKYGFDLPREGEWEYASRGGKGYEYGTDDGTISSTKANYNSNVGYPTNVGSYPKNPFGLYDLAGNVWEWCSDWYGSYSSENATDPQGPANGSSRVKRGGCWSSAGSCRSAYRNYDYPDYGNYYIGFRVVRR